jgi:hypothetical protein
MTSIEVPDWVAAVALEACGEHFTGSDDDMKAALTAALGAWVVPAQFQARARFMEYHWCEWEKFKDEPTRDSWFDAISRTDGWQAEMRTLYTLRQEKPE